MSFILAAQRQSESAKAAFQEYREYLAAHAADFPSGAYCLATCDWYFNPHDHRCPHDAWLEGVSIAELGSGERSEERFTTLRVRLLGAYHDGFIELVYPSVFRYTLSSPSAVRGLGDWLYDEFRVSAAGHLIHEIEWAGFHGAEGSRWIIEASDVEFHWSPK